MVAPAMVPGPRIRAAAPVALLVAFVAALYAPALGAGFVNWDDDRFITANPLFSGPVKDYVRAALARLQFEAYHPLHLLSYLPDRLLWPSSPAGFHALNLALYAAALVVLFRLLRRVFGDGPALAAVLVFAAHPLCVEPVAWISARKDVLALLLVAAALALEDRALDRPQVRLWALGLAALACLAKTSAVVTPVVVVAWHAFIQARPLSLALRRAAPFAVIALAAGVVVPFVWRDHRMLWAERPLPLPVDVAGTLGFYAQQVVWPARLAPVYPPVVAHQGGLAAFVILAAAATAIAWRRLPLAGRYAAVVFVGCLAPVSNLLPLHYRFADRYAFLALAALTPAAAAVGRALGQRRPRLAVALLAVVLGVASAVTRTVLPAWRDSVTLWSRAREVQPAALTAHLKLGEALRGARRWDEAAAAYVRAMRLVPGNPLPLAGLFTTFADEAVARGAVTADDVRRWQATFARTGSDEWRAALREMEARCPRCARAAAAWAAGVQPR